MGRKAVTVQQTRPREAGIPSKRRSSTEQVQDDFLAIRMDAILWFDYEKIFVDAEIFNDCRQGG